MNNRKVSWFISLKFNRINSLFVHSVYQFMNNVSQNSSYIWLGLGFY